jgi:uncharacterized membrane protein YphA (DoxX/SURF4 family)
VEELKTPRAVAFLRAMFGLLLVLQVLPNLDYSFIERLPEQLDTYALDNPYPQYRWLLHYVAAPNVEQLGTILSVGQFLVGMALIIGFLIRFTACLGMVYAVNLLIAAGHTGFFPQAFGVLLLLVFVTLVVADAGMYYGADGFIFKPRKKESKSQKMKFRDKKQKAVIESLNKQIKGSKKRKSKAQPVEVD